MSISFETNPVLPRTPTHHFEVSGARAVQSLSRANKKVLVAAIKLSTGVQPELTIQRVTSGDQADVNAGVGSPAAQMCRRIKKWFPTLDLWLCPIDELAAGTAGTVTLTIVGTTSVAGTLHLMVAGEYIPISIPANSSPTVAAAAVVTQYNAHAKKPHLPFTALSALGVVTFTQRWKGIDVADIRVNHFDGNILPTGMTSATVAAGVAGAGNPDVDEIIDVLGGTQWHRMVSQFTDASNMLKWEQELERRYRGDVQQEGHVFGAMTGTYSALSTYGAARNSKQSTVYDANTSPTPPWLIIATTAAAISAKLDPAAPLTSTLVPGIVQPKRTDWRTREERDLLLRDGISTFIYDDGGNTYIERSINTYQTNAQSVEDVTWLDNEPKFTLEAIRYDLLTSVSLQFQGYKLASDGADLPVGQKVVTPNSMRAFIGSRYDIWAAQGWVELASKQQFMDELLVQRDPDDVNRLICQLGPDLMNQFRGMSGQIAFIL